MSKITPEKALDLSFYCGDLDSTLTIREYFKALLTALWEKEESFSGKYPFGNSGWQYALQLPLVRAGAIKGEILRDDEDDDYEEVDEVDHDEYEQFVLDMIDAL